MFCIKVATTSAYGDRKIGLVIAHAMKEVGKKLDRIFISVSCLFK